MEENAKKIQPISVQQQEIPQSEETNIPDGYILVTGINEDGSNGDSFFTTLKMERYYSDTTKYIIKKKKK